MKATPSFPLLSGSESFPETMLGEHVQLCWHSVILFLMSLWNFQHDYKASKQFCLNINILYSWFPSDISFQKDIRQCLLLECLLNTFSFTHLNGSHHSPGKYLISLEFFQHRNSYLGDKQILQIQALYTTAIMGHGEPISFTRSIKTLCFVYWANVTET